MRDSLLITVMPAIFRCSVIVVLSCCVLIDRAVAQSEIKDRVEFALSGSVAVVPFSNITGDSRDDWIGSGIAETVMASLGSDTDSVVVNPDLIREELRESDLSSASSMTNAALLQLGNRLRARWIVTGGYQYLDERIRVTGRLIEVSTGSVVRSVKIDGAITELFDVQDRLASDLVFGVAVNLDVTQAAVSPELESESVADEFSSEGREFNDVSPGERALQLRIETGAPPPPKTPNTISRNNDGGATIRAVRLSEDLNLDGQLDEQVYRTVPSFGDLIQLEPVAGVPMTEKTELWIFFDESTLYLAARCWDGAPESEWVVNEMRRDSFNVLQNEELEIILDTFYDRRNAVIFNVNPIGGRMDGEIANERDYNGDWNPVWTLETGRFEGGWSVEMAIPFRSLRYRPGRSQIWGINVGRNIMHKNEWGYLTRTDPGLGRGAIFQISRSATMVGLEVPAGGRPLEIKPYLIGDVSSDANVSPVLSNEFGGNVGIDIKYGVTANVTADFTVNTDFAQVEADEQQVNLTRFSLFFPEKREFFLENQGVFGFGGARRGPFGGSADTPILFYSRQIGLNNNMEVPIIAGGRVTGRVGKLRLGVINIHTDSEPTARALSTNFSVARLSLDMLRRSSVGAIFTSRSALADRHGSNQAYGVDGVFNFYENVAINTYWAKTQTTGKKGRDTSYKGDFRYNGDRYGLTAEHLFVDSKFSPGVGFLRRSDFRKSFGEVRFSPRPQAIEAVRKFTWDGSYDYITDATGNVETREVTARFETEFESSDHFEISYADTFDVLREPFRIAPGVVLPPGEYEFWNATTETHFGPQRRITGAVFAEHGSFYGGTKTTFGVGGAPFGGRVELTPQFSFQPSMSFNWIDLPQGRFDTKLVTTRTTYTISPLMFVSALIQYNSSNNGLSSNIRLRWEYQPGSELFVVYNEQRDMLAPRSVRGLENRALIVKVTKLFRF